MGLIYGDILKNSFMLIIYTLKVICNIFVKEKSMSYYKKYEL